MALSSKFKQYFIVGISGTTNSGKSSVAKMLCKRLPGARHMCQDSYFWEPDDPRVEVDEEGTQMWERLSALNMDEMMRDVQSWIDDHRLQHSPSILIVEGFLIFNHKPLSALMDLKYFIQVDKDACKARRNKRVYNPPDPPNYFEKVVWPYYLLNLEQIQDQKDIRYLDGSTDLHTLYEQVLEGISSLQTK